MRTIRCLTFGAVIVAALALDAPATDAQYQDQACTFTAEDECYRCQASATFECRFIDCHHCNEGFCIRIAAAADGSGEVQTICSKVTEGETPLSWTVFLRPVSVGRQAPRQPGQIAMRMIPQPEAPATLIQMSYGFPDAVREGVFRNLSNRVIAGARIGYVAVAENGTESLQVGRMIPLQDQLPPRGDVKFTNPGVGKDFSKIPNLSSLEFFVAEVTFDDGEVWKEDGTTLRRQFEAATRAAAEAPDR